MKKTKLIVIIPIVTLLIVGISVGVLAQVYTATDDTKDNDETSQKINKVYTPDPVEVTVTIDRTKLIQEMQNDDADIASILARRNARQVKYDESLTGMNSKEPLIGNSSCSLSELPIIVVPEPDEVIE